MAKRKKDIENKVTESFTDSVTKSVDKLFGKSLVFGQGFATKRLSTLPDYGSDLWISTGSIIIDGAIGRPGIPVGKLITLFGPAGSGKTTQLIHFMKEAQKKNYNVVYIDSEGKFDPARSRLIGVDNSKVLYYSQLTMEQMFGLCLTIAREAVKLPESERVPTIICVDSHSALATKGQINQEVTDLDSKNNVADAAKNTRLGLKLLIPLLPDAKIALVFVCQPTMQIGGMKSFGPVQETYVAQRAIDHHSILRLKYRRGSTILDKPKDQGGISLGGEVWVTVEDSRISPPKKSASIQCFDETGFNDIDSLMNLGIDYGLIKAYGAGYFNVARYSEDTKKFYRRDFKNVYDNDPALRHELFCLAQGWLK